MAAQKGYLMKLKYTDHASDFRTAVDEDWFEGVRLKERRTSTLRPGGRAALTLFEQAISEGRPHPRLQVSVPPAQDPDAPADLLGSQPPTDVDAAAFVSWVHERYQVAADLLKGLDSAPQKPPPKGSEHFVINSVRCQRTERFFEQVRAALEVAGKNWDEAGRNKASYALAVLEEEAYAGDIRFDNADTGTYHSFEHDKPFVHYLESILTSLPDEGGKPFACLPSEQQESLRRQREQAGNHLDFLMRRKYAYNGITETDIERSLGGFLIDRRTRMIVSETKHSKKSLQPEYEILRVPPRARNPHKGAYVYRDGDKIRLQDGTESDYNPAALRRIPVAVENLTFRRAPNDPFLRKGMRFDWQANGYVQSEPIGWISWAGHCDIKAVMEQLGIALLDHPSLTEYRSDTGGVTRYDRAKLLEMVASVMELGSIYDFADGSGAMKRGIHDFGGFRNDSKPDRIQFTGLRQGMHFRWPIKGRQEDFRIKSIEDKAGKLDVSNVFGRWLPDTEKLDFSKNPRFLKTLETESDYNLIDVTGAKMSVEAKLHSFDKKNGYPVKESKELLIDLSEGRSEERQFLGTHLQDGARREIYRIYLDPKPGALRILAEYEQWQMGRDGWEPKRSKGEDIVVVLREPLEATLSREMKRDDPASFQTLIKTSLRTGQNICADTDMKSEVWNGVVYRIKAERLKSNDETRVEHWRIRFDARFGQAILEYLVRRGEDGEPEAYCPAKGEGDWQRSPDFLWRDFPDVGSKGTEGGEWIVNRSMKERGIVQVRWKPNEEGGFYVEDDHIKNVYEMIYAGLGDHPFTIVHMNKRYGFGNEDDWLIAIDKLRKLRGRLRFEGDGARADWPEVEHLDWSPDADDSQTDEQL